MKKVLILLVIAVLFSGCDYFKIKGQNKALQTDIQKLSEQLTKMKTECDTTVNDEKAKMKTECDTSISNAVTKTKKEECAPAKKGATKKTGKKRK